MITTLFCRIQLPVSMKLSDFLLFFCNLQLIKDLRLTRHSLSYLPSALSFSVRLAADQHQEERLRPQGECDEKKCKIRSKIDIFDLIFSIAYHPGEGAAASQLTGSLP
jgi:hypothetical protein